MKVATAVTGEQEDVTPYYTDEAVTLYHGDNRDVLATLPSNSVDACVTDPPYELGFMGRRWDSSGIAYDKYLWAEVWRVLKPGGHLLAFGGTRTWHRLAVAIEDAGFDVRDSMAWMYGSGFPKSLDVSKELDKVIDKAAGAERRDVILTVTSWVAQARNAAGLNNRQIDEHFGMNGMAGHWTSSKSQPSVPTAEQWPRLLELFGVDEPPQEVRDAVDEWLRIKGQPVPTWSLREVTGHHEQPVAGQSWNANYGLAANLQPKERRDKPATEAAKQWQGWGTALKPAFEPIVVARKPLIGTVAENVQQYGTGALNIDGCRIATGDRCGGKAKATGGFVEGYEAGDGWTLGSDKGRWPANVILDESQAAELDRQSGVTTLGAAGKKGSSGFAGGYDGEYDVPYADTGGASRFFYTAKASSAERPNVNGVAHPTVKPLELMQYLVRLVTPLGGTVLEPFAGSGTTAEACIVEGFKCIAIEMTDEYLPLILQRISKPIEVTLL
jgi:hypothetical protein